jgi:hypothetical protein
MASQTGITDRASVYECTIRHSPRIVCNHCKIVTSVTSEVTDQEWLIIGHYRGDCHDTTWCPACVVDAQLAQSVITVRKITDALVTA